ncbi:hypothetical protein NA56DRAFT_706447 [Hyaloscypha hepaticicola]|uniref:Uncharacterized protein n=1 Tax=Hyaloscypha hepaticicola TaxID=2082293 RepID=A0A2J6PWY2_9HELO|nr:hypothetical protein NA56DRAFT_706447 [Hyaloscypha hepaticicola]
MKFSLMLLLPAALTASAQMIEVRATACGAGNNCQRGVGGTAGNKPPLSSRLADCSSLNTVTVTPAPFTTATTSSVLEVMTIKARQADEPGSAVTVTPTAVPTYATYCSNPLAYYSACSCAGATPITTTMPTPTVTVTEQASITCALKRKVKRGLQVVGGVFDYGRM